MKNNIKKCPFCGGTANIIQLSTGINHNGTIENSYAIQCGKCKSSTRAYTSKIYQDSTGEVTIEANGALEAINQWNMRVGDEK